MYGEGGGEVDSRVRGLDVVVRVLHVGRLDGEVFHEHLLHKKSTVEEEEALVLDSGDVRVCEREDVSVDVYVREENGAGRRRSCGGDEERADAPDVHTRLSQRQTFA